MIHAEDILQATDGGRLVLLHLFPGTEEYFGAKKMFKLRQGERTASASYKWTGKKWLVNDFGEEGKATDAIGAWEKVRGCDFRTALAEIAAQWDIKDADGHSPSLYAFEETVAPTDAREGERLFRLRAFTEAEVRLMCPNATPSLLKEMGWEAVERTGKVKNGHVKWIISTPQYPIFRRRCPVEGAEPFYKIYYPKAPSKADRFRHWPADAKPAAYIHGLEELRRRYVLFNEAKEKELRNTPGKEDAPYHEEKLNEVIICSGERDAVCAAAMGYSAVWFNSETEDPDGNGMQQLRKYAKHVYNIPDLDETGVRQGAARALRFRWLRTVWLPQWLRRDKDERGRPKKDLRDWFGNYGRKRSQFENLLGGAIMLDFIYEKKDAKQGKAYAVQPTRLLEFLRLNGFHTLKDDTALDPRFVHIDGHVVREVFPKDMSTFVMNWAREQHLSEQELAAVITTPYMAPAKLAYLEEANPDFTNNGLDWQMFYTDRYRYRVTADGITPVGEEGGSVWDYKVVPMKAQLADPFFTITHDHTAQQNPWRIEVKDFSSPYFCYLINTARIYWRKEMEYRFDAEHQLEATEYAARNRFRIDGEGLTPDEVHEQMQNLVNKIFTVGYLCHRHKAFSRGWAVIALDNAVGATGESNGGTGKTVFFTVLKQYIKMVQFDGKQADVVADPHQYEEVDCHTDLIFVDDCTQGFRVNKYFSLITGGIPINVKHKKRYTLEFKDSPKFAFSSNYPQMDVDGSTIRRLLYMTFSDYYHTQAPNNDYRQTRRVFDDFGIELYGDDYTQQQRDADFNFIMQCTRFYLSVVGSLTAPIQPSMGNVELRRVMAIVGKEFLRWADSYFAPERGNLDRFLVRREVYEAYTAELSDNRADRVGAGTFSENLALYAKFCPWIAEFNPRDMAGRDGRILKTIEGKTTELFYLRSAKPPVAASEDSTLPF